MKRLGFLIWLIVAIPVSALIQASVMARLWSWFLSAQYGPGPSLGAWFGVSAIVWVVTMHLSTKSSNKDDKIADVITATVARWTILGLELIVALGVGYVFGWVR